MTDGLASSLELTEAIAASGSSAPRISLTMIKNAIADVQYMVPGSHMTGIGQDGAHPLNRLTLCFVVTFSGFVVVGKSAAMSAENFDVEKGRVFAYEDAVRQLWPLMAFSEIERKHRG